MKNINQINHFSLLTVIVLTLSSFSLASYGQVKEPANISETNLADKPWLNAGKITNQEWRGFKVYEFSIDDFTIQIAEPKNAAPGKPWVLNVGGVGDGYHWEINEDLLNAGAYVVGIDSYNTYGSDYGLDLMDSLYNIARTQFDLPQKCTLFGVSRAGLSVYRWAIRHPQRVASIYCEGPVLDFKTWPMSWAESAGDWVSLKKQYGFVDDATAITYKGNPIDNLKPIAEANIPLRHVISLTEDHDTKIVPNEKNTLKAQRILQAMGHDIDVVITPKGDKAPFVSDKASVEFMMQAARTK